MKNITLNISKGLILCLFGLLVSSDISGQFSREVYLQSIGETQAVVRYRTNSSVDTRVYYGTNPTFLTQSFINTTNVTEHTATLTGLTPNTKYYYGIRRTSNNWILAPNANNYFYTFPSTGTKPEIDAWIVGDCGTANQDQMDVRDAYYNYMNGDHTDLFLMLGDNAYNNGTDAEHQNAVFNIYTSILKNTPLFPTPGNHEFGNGSTSSASGTGPYYDIFNLPTAGESGGLASGTEAYYSFDYGNIHFINMDSHDSDRSVGGAMYNWLQNDLAATTQDWIIAYWHHPPYSKGSHDSDAEGQLIQIRQNFLPLLESYGVDLVMSGHSHSYERSKQIHGNYGLSSSFVPSMEIDGSSGNENTTGPYMKDLQTGPGTGAVYITAGASGKISTGYPLNHPVMYVSQARLGSCHLNVHGDTLRLKYIDANGGIFDEFTILKTFPIGDPPTVAINTPTNSQFFPTGTPVNITATAADTDGTVTQVEYCVDGVPIGNGGAAPTYPLTWNPPANGTYTITAKATDDSTNVTVSQDVVITVGVTTATFSIVTGNDDAEEHYRGDVGLMSTDLELSQDANNGRQQQLIGMRYQNVSIPKDAIIQSAHIQFTVDETANVNPSNLIIVGELSSNAATYAATSGNISSRPQTQAEATWSPPNWNAVGAAGADQRTVDIKDIIQEIIDQPQWQTNNSVALMIGGCGRRVPESYNGSPAQSPKLVVTYMPAQQVPANPPTVNMTYPRNGMLFPLGTAITLDAEVSDPGSYITKVDYYANGTYIGTENFYPFTLPITLNTPGTFNVVAVATDNTGATGSSAGTTVTVDGSVSLSTETTAISQSTDDAEETLSTGAVDLTSTDMELVDNGGCNPQADGLRFTGIDVPQGASIVKAYIQFEADENVNWYPSRLHIKGSSVLNPGTFTTANGSISGMATTTAEAFWHPRSWPTVGAAGADQQTIDISAVVQEMIDNPGWVSGSAMAFQITGSGGRIATTFNGTSAPQLIIQYPGNANITRGPYLQMGTENSMIVRFRTDVAGAFTINYGTALGSLTNTITETVGVTEHEVLITGLTPGTKYFYEIVGVGGALVPSASDVYFQTSPTIGSKDKMRAWILGDPGTANNNQRAVRDAYFNYVGTNHTDAMILLGDNAYGDGTDIQYQYAMFENMYENKIKNTVMWSCPGNHEFYNGYTSSATNTGPYYDIFNFPETAEAGGLASGTEAYYSFDYGNVHFISMDSHDSDRSIGGSMLTWLQNDLASTTQDWIVAFFHHPPYTKGSHNSDNPGDSGGRLDQMRQRVLPILEAAGVDLVLSGHSHSYERSYQIKGHYGYSNTWDPSTMLVDGVSGDLGIDRAYCKNINGTQEGTVYITMGSSGKISGGALNHPVMYSSLNQLGSCVLEVDSMRLDLKFLNSGGNVSDKFTIYKGDPPTANMVSPAPYDQMHFPQPYNLQVTGTSINGAEFYANGVQVATTYNAAGLPVSANWTPPANGLYEIYADVIGLNGIKGRSDTTLLYVGNVFNTCVQVDAGSDDAHEIAGTPYLNGTFIYPAAAYTGGLRFNDVQIPQGVRVTDAELNLWANLTGAGTTDLLVMSEAVDNAAAMSGSANNITSRTYNASTGTSDISNWVGGNMYTQAGIEVPIEEVVMRPGYQFGNSILLKLNTSSHLRQMVTFEQDPTKAAELCATFTFCPTPDTTFFYQTDCDPANVGTTYVVIQNADFCDSVLATVTTLLPTDSTYISSTTCDPNLAGLNVTVLTNQYGCDSTIFDTVTLLPTSATTVNYTTCISNQAGTVVSVFQNQFGCDSTVTFIITYIPPDTTNIAVTTCNVASAGTNTVTLNNQYGCDSLIVTTTSYDGNLADSTTVNLTTCVAANANATGVILTNAAGCDSVVTTITAYIPPDTTNVNLLTCNIASVGVANATLTNQYGCDSLVITTTSYDPSQVDSITVNATTCVVGNAGTTYAMLLNSAGCDSIVTTITTLGSTDTTQLAVAVCNVGSVGTSSVLLSNQFGCDSYHL